MELCKRHLEALSACDKPDLTKKGVLSPSRVDAMQLEAAGLRLLYATERVDEKVIGALTAFAEEADVLASMEAMQRGEVINRIEGYESEERRVLHTATRDIFERRQRDNPAAELTERAYAELEKLKKFLSDIEGEGITDLIQVGIGGSDLGPRAIALALKAYGKEGRRLHFVSNVDPDDMAATLKAVPLERAMCVIISKSGTTLETATNEQFIRRAYEEAGIDPKRRCLAVTMQGSPMDDPNRYRASFYIWDSIGGRYSATSMVGCVSLAFLIGMERLLEFLKGASEMDSHALTKSTTANMPLMGALLSLWNRNILGYPTLAVIPYSQALHRFPAHLQQLTMESNGKRVDRHGNVVDYETGAVIWGEPGTNGQHSFYQLIHQGTSPVPLECIGFAESQMGLDIEFEGTTSQQKLLANLFAQIIGLATGKESDNPNPLSPGNRPSRLILAKRCDPHTVGALLVYYEHVTAFLGFLWGINSFDQEGVQLGKVLASSITESMSGKGEKGSLPVADRYLSYVATLLS